MFFFLIKKSFFDGWDNMLSLIILNLVYIGILALGFVVPANFISNPAAGISIMVIAYFLFFLYSGIVSRNIVRMGDFKRPAIFSEFRTDFLETWKNSLLLSIGVALIGGLLFFSIRFYLAQSHFVSLAGGVFLLWILILSFVSLFYFYPAMNRLGNQKFRVVLKKCFILFFDNPLMSIGMAVYTLILFIISIALAFFLPGLAGLQLLHSNSVRLLLFKYDYLEENTDANRKKIPWDALLIEEKERLGPRGLKDMIFPWKN